MRIHRYRHEIEGELEKLEALDDPTGEDVETILELFAELDSLDRHEVRQ